MTTFEKFKILLDKDKNEAYNYLHNNLKPLIFKKISQYTKISDDMEDLSQDVWIKIYKNIDKYKGGNFIVWINTLCNRICIDKYRIKKTNRANYNTANINDDFNLIIDSSNFFENKYSSKNLLYTEILNSFNTLNENQQDLFLMKIKGLTYQEISVLTKENRFTIYDRHKSTIIEIIKQLEHKGIVKSKEIKKNKNRHKTPNNLKLYIQV
jgi:RNA polymerase sigma-70 factor (ECF subfamily)